MTIQDTDYRTSPPPRGRAYPVPSDHPALRRIEARRRAVMRAAHPERARAQVGPWGPIPPEPEARRENRIATVLRCVDTLALGVMSAWVLAQWPLAYSVLMGWI